MGTLGALLLIFQAALSDSPGYADYQRANRLLVAKQFAECAAALDDSLRLDAKLTPALTLKAKLAMAMSRFDLARQSLDRALAVEPRSAYAHFLYGLQFYIPGDLEAALPHFAKAHELDAADPRAALYLGLTSESLGDTGAAMPLYREARRLERLAPAGPQTETLLPGARLLLLLGQFDEAELWIREAIEAAPNVRDVHFERARFWLRRGEAAKAAEEGENALRLKEGDVSDIQVHYLLVRAWTQAGMPDRAAGHAAALRSLEKENGPIDQAPSRVLPGK